MTEHNKALPTVQEDELQRKVAFIRDLDLAEFQQKAIRPRVHFGGWFRERYKCELTRPDQIAEETRAAYIPAYEAWLRKRAWDQIEAEELPPLDPDDDRPRRGPIGDRHHEDDAADDAESRDDDGEEAGGDHEEASSGRVSVPRYRSVPLDPPAPVVETRDRATEDREVLERERQELVAQGFSPDTILDDDGNPIDPAEDDPRLVGVGLEAIEDDGAELYVVPGIIPTEGASMCYGEQKHGKSIWAQKLAVCITSDGLDFDGLNVRHGRVLYITADSGARRRQVKTRFLQICERLNVAPPTVDRLVIVDTAVKLNDPKSVEDLLRKNPGAFVLVVIDPLFRCVNGRLSGEEVAADIDQGLTRIAEATSAACLVVHHEPAATDKPFGSVFLQAGGVAQIHAVRHVKGGVYRDGDKVTVTVQWLKNDEPPAKPFEYRIEAAYLAGSGDKRAAESVGALAPAPGTNDAPEWEKAGVSRATWFRRKAEEAEQAEQV
jgi:hypothetical protein